MIINNTCTGILVYAIVAVQHERMMVFVYILGWSHVYIYVYIYIYIYTIYTRVEPCMYMHAASGPDCEAGLSLAGALSAPRSSRFGDFGVVSACFGSVFGWLWVV